MPKKKSAEVSFNDWAARQYQLEKTKAKAAGTKFDISLGDFKTLLRGECFLCGAPRTDCGPRAHRVCLYSPAMDYTWRNCRTLCAVCDVIRQGACFNDLFAFLRIIHLRWENAIIGGAIIRPSGAKIFREHVLSRQRFKRREDHKYA